MNNDIGRTIFDRMTKMILGPLVIFSLIDGQTIHWCPVITILKCLTLIIYSLNFLSMIKSIYIHNKTTDRLALHTIRNENNWNRRKLIMHQR